MQKARGLETSWVFQEVDYPRSCIKRESQRISLGHLRLIGQGGVGIYPTPHPRPRRPTRRDWARMREKMLARGVRVARRAGGGRRSRCRPPAPAAPPRGPAGAGTEPAREAVRPPGPRVGASRDHCRRLDPGSGLCTSTSNGPGQTPSPSAFLSSSRQSILAFVLPSLVTHKHEEKEARFPGQWENH